MNNIKTNSIQRREEWKELNHLKKRFPCFGCINAKKVWAYVLDGNRPTVVCGATLFKQKFPVPDNCDSFEETEVE